MNTVITDNRATYDHEIRLAFHKKKLANHHKCEETLVINELGILNGSSRIDIAVLNGFFHGYEIKSSRDSLTRLSSQLDAYRQSFQKVTYIAAPNHINGLNAALPDWCGLILVTKGDRGAIHFSTLRKAKNNPEINSEKLAHLLWKNEAQDLLIKLGVDKKYTRGNRASLYELIGKKLLPQDLFYEIKTTLQSRKNWRAESELT